MSVELSVIISAHNEERHLPAQLDALVSQSWEGEWEVIVVDNRSSDSTAAIVRDYAARDPRVRLLQAHEVAGQSYGMNAGAKAARGEHLAFCDADDIVSPQWVSAIGEGLRHYEIVTGPHELDRLNPPWLAESRGRSIEEPVGSFFGIFPCIRGAGWGIQRAVWDDVGGMREDYHAGQDIEFSLRCWRRGHHVVGIPGAVVHYRYREAPRALWRQGLAYGTNRPRIARLLADEGLPRPPRFAGARSWLLLLLRLPSLVTPRGRAVWMWIAGNRVGQVIGSWRERVTML